ncbi:MAG: VCBS repeat-containing protein [Acidobacteria bacterium]|nr:MAG: VCBS repeat-containing protein [Acidobacteriota bacterium]
MTALRKNNPSLFSLPLLSFLIFVSAPSQTNDKSPHWPMFRKHLLDEGANESAAVADVNQDGRLDIICGENWFEAPSWKKHRMREIPFIEGYIDDLSNFALDVNGDGYPDVIASSWFSKKLAWYENPRRHDGEWSNVLWKEHIIETYSNYELILLVDMDGDGKPLEILPNYGTSGDIAWLERAEPFSKGEWIRDLVGAVPGAKGLHGIGAGDLNGDGHPDIITPRGWFESPANPRSGKWTFHADFTLVPDCSPIYVQDVNSDGKNDLVFGAGHSYGVFWLENKGTQWQLHQIDNSWSQAHPMTLADLDHDGKLDIVTAKRYLAHEGDPGAYEPLGLYWYRLGEKGQYIKHVIDYGSKAGGGIQTPVVDIDGDGDLDLVAPGKSGLFLFEQIDFPRQKAH